MLPALIAFSKQGSPSRTATSGYFRSFRCWFGSSEGTTKHESKALLPRLRGPLQHRTPLSSSRSHLENPCQREAHIDVLRRGVVANDSQILLYFVLDDHTNSSKTRICSTCACIRNADVNLSNTFNVPESQPNVNVPTLAAIQRSAYETFRDFE